MAGIESHKNNFEERVESIKVDEGSDIVKFEKNIVEENLEFEEAAPEKSEKAKEAIIQLRSDFHEYVQKNNKSTEQLLRHLFVEKGVSAKPSDESLDELVQVVSKNPEVLRDIRKVALLSEFLWKEKGFMHQHEEIVKRNANTRKAQIEEAKMFREGTYHDLHDTLLTKIGDCNRLGTILIDLAQNEGIPLQPYCKEEHFATAIKVSSAEYQNVIVLETEDGSLHFDSDYNKMGLFKLKEGRTDVKVENLRDEYLSLEVSAPYLIQQGQVTKLKDRMSFLGTELLNYKDHLDLKMIGKIYSNGERIGIPHETKEEKETRFFETLQQRNDADTIARIIVDWACELEYQGIEANMLREEVREMKENKSKKVPLEAIFSLVKDVALKSGKNLPVESIDANVFLLRQALDSTTVIKDIHDKKELDALVEEFQTQKQRV